MRCNRNAIGSQERFTVVDAGRGRVALRGNNNRFVSSRNGRRDMNCTENRALSQERFTLGNAGNNRITLKGSNGRYISSEDGRRDMRCNRTADGPWEKFNVVVAGANRGPTGRIAIVADGNYRDTDDICATPVSLALIAKTGNRRKLVHYSHSCDLRPAGRDAGQGDETNRENAMQVSCDGTASRWGGFPNVSRFFNCRRQRSATVRDLKNAINASSSGNPLTIIEAGEPDIIFEAMDDANRAARAHVRIVTHHPNNDRGDNYDLSDVEALGGYRSGNTIRIPNQNDELKRALSSWNWARNHRSSNINWLYQRGQLAQQARWGYNGIRGDFDCSDAGMVYHWIFGKRRPTMADLRRELTR